MINKAALTAMAALVLVAGCDSSSNDTAGGNNAAGAAPAAGAPVTQASVTGTWGQDNCTNTITLNADGTATSMTAEQGNNRWSLDGSTIVITSPGEADVRMPATLRDGELHISGGGGEGQSAVFTRCPAESGAAAATSNDSGNEAVDEAAE